MQNVNIMETEIIQQHLDGNEGQIKHINLEHIYEYYIFINKIITVNCEEYGKIEILIIDHQKDCFKAEVIKNDLSSELSVLYSKELCIKLDYKSKLLQLKTKILNSYIDNNKTIIVFEKPIKGILSRVRANRVLIDSSIENINAYAVIIHNQKEKKKYKIVNIKEISINSINIYLDRKDGIVMPGDVVDELNVFIRDELVISASGIIIKIEYQNTIDNIYLAIVKINEESIVNNVVINKRETERYQLMKEYDSYIDAIYPLLCDCHVYGNISDISKLGASILITKSKLPLFVGLIFPEVYLQFPYQKQIKASFKITYCKVMQNNSIFSCKIGVLFVNIKQEFINAISYLIEKIKDSRYCIPTKEDFNDIIMFFFEVGFIYPQKRKQLQNYMGFVLDSQYKILTSSSIIKTIMFKEEDEIKGYLFALKFYDNTWNIQHFSGGNSANVKSGRVVLDAMIKYFLEHKINEIVGTDYITTYFRPNNIMPTIIFTEIKNIINDKNASDIFEYDYCTIINNNDLKECNNNYLTVEAGNDDFRQLEQLLLKQKLFNDINIEGLNYENIVKINVSTEFEKIGLYRYRKVFVLKDENKSNLAYGVCNYSSAGINLSELTNSFKIYYSLPNTHNQEITDMLVDKILLSYKDTSMDNPVYLKNTNDILPTRYESHKKYRVFFVSGARMQHLASAIEDVYKNMKMFIRKFREGRYNTL
jgi:hypothetical protein